MESLAALFGAIFAAPVHYLLLPTWRRHGASDDDRALLVRSLLPAQAQAQAQAQTGHALTLYKYVGSSRAGEQGARVWWDIPFAAAELSGVLPELLAAAGWRHCHSAANPTSASASASVSVSVSTPSARAGSAAVARHARCSSACPFGSRTCDWQLLRR